MEYRTLPRGGERIGVIGMGVGSILGDAVARAESVVRHAVERGVNLFDTCAAVEEEYEAFGRGIQGVRDKVLLQVHAGPSYDSGRYEFSRDDERGKYWFHQVMRYMGTDYADFGNVHCIDRADDARRIIDGGFLDWLVAQRDAGTVRRLMFSTHTPEIAHLFLDTGAFDLFMFSVNAAYDSGAGAYGNGSTYERAALYQRAQREGVGISVMKTFAGGLLLDARRSPLGVAMTHAQCIQYALDQPGVVSVLPGCASAAEIDQALAWLDAPAAERDWSQVRAADGFSAAGRCVYCNHCAPCPAGIDIGLVNKYYDLARLGDALAKAHYRDLPVHAGACLGCGHCNGACPFGVAQRERMAQIADWFGE